MSYIEKEKLIKADIASIENRVRHAFNQGYDLGYKEGKESAKPQEQEPFKPMVEIDLDYVIKQKYIEREVLDKIKADLYKLYNDRPSDYNHSQRTELFCEVIKILDKYKSEREDNNE